MGRKKFSVIVEKAAEAKDYSILNTEMQGFTAFLKEFINAVLLNSNQIIHILSIHINNT